MKLYLVRHGRAEEKAAWRDNDARRPLTDRGREETLAIATQLACLGVAPDVLLTSPFARASQTAAIIAEALGVSDILAEEPLLAPGFDLAACARLLKGHSTAETIMIVGHEPSFSAVASQLVGGGRIDLKKSGVIHICIDQTDPPAGTLRWLVTPKLLGSNVPDRDGSE
jgi:phosphohistidine phosphatase